ncbi:LOW QUALITY PROTEIN: uncharacterized protein LOC105427878 [Pogonomyrmex barbatus]|uniref:LOW QUALITY PROTEIN: uncharacterized protein LOC105427878 n=1 Tax=Pogonomyrmex barbatus TaxID=144034 RepID=A0A8N1S8B2_9HYME|nr:LOW QUALITY PROTEIN: uncharacterized protein LOC105427878 [Pogonomyrmex barbatus]
MKLLFLFLASYVFLQSLFVHATDLNEYLNEKLRQSKIEFIKIHIQKISSVQEKSYRVHWDQSWQILLLTNHQPFMINIFHETYILDSNRLMIPFFNATWNKTYGALRETYVIKKESNVKFVKSIVWKNTTYLLLCYEDGLCNLHTINSNILRFRHTIGYKGIPVDAKFFTQADQLYLIIANNAEKFPVPSVIYRWSGTYMDVVTDVMTIGAVSVTAFEYRQSTIIVFVQSNAENPRIGSEVYEFKDSNVARIQFLSTARPTSVHHYIHGDFNFALIINELGPSDVFCWDGRELLDWFSLPDIEPHSLISFFHMDGDTFVVMAHNNIIKLYKFHSTSDWKNEDIKRFKDNQKIVDMTTSLNEYTMTVTLIIQEENEYWVEQWEAVMTSVPVDNKVEDVDVKQCFSDLIEKLQARMPALREAKASWKFLLPSAKNLTISEPMNFDSLILQSGTVDSIELVTEEEILPPHQIAEVLEELEHEVYAIEARQSKWRTMIDTVPERFIANDVYVEELEIDNIRVDLVNDMNVSEIIFPTGEQYFTQPLHAKNLIVDNFEIESLCGIPPEYWMLQDDSEGVAFTIANSSVEYSNDTVVLSSDLTIPKLKVKNLNGINIDELINDLFIMNQNQKINGTITYKDSVQIVNLTTQFMNGFSSDELMTTTTNQSFDYFYAKILHIEDLYAETINGVPVKEAARKSRKNVIKGKLKLANLRVTENLVIDVNASMIKIPDQFLQIYENVTILGDLHLQNLKVENSAALFVEDLPVNIKDIFDRYWTKSTNQTITEKITLEGGFTIDRLNTKYLNGFAESDFLYTTMKEIPSDFTNLRFENFHVDDFFLENGFNGSFFEVKPDAITIREKLHVQTLQAKDIITLSFNGVTVENIMNKTCVNFSGTVELPIARARRVFVDNLDVRFLNHHEVFFGDGLRFDDDHQLSTLQVPEIHIENLEVEKLNGFEMNLLWRLGNLTSSDLNDIVIDGDLTLRNLMVAQVNGQSTESFLEELSQNDIVIKSERDIEYLVVQNITLESLRGWKFDDMIANVLSKSREQTITGHFSAHVITSDNVTIDFINGQNTSQLMWIDEPLMITNNVTFTDLFVEGDVMTSKMNGRGVRELYDSLLYIPAKNIDLLTVDKNISWNTPLNSFTSISNLLNNAVTKDKEQVIMGNVIFTKDVRAWAVNANYKVVEEINHIVSDVVIDDGEVIEIKGQKIFKKDFVVDSLTVNGDLGIANINNVNILKFNDSVVRQNNEDTIVGPLTFLTEVKVEKLYVNDTDLNASINGAVRSSDVMPDNIIFEELNVLNDVYLQNFDGIDFDKFVNDRVTLSGDHNISCDVRFNGIVTVTGNANIRKINGIFPSEFVLNDIDEMQIINGVKTFTNDLIVDGNVISPRINNVDIMKEYNDGVQNTDEDVDIYGDLVFKADVRIKNINISGLVNGVNLHFASSNYKNINETRENMEKHWRVIEQNIEYISQVSETLRNVFFYLEAEEDLEIPGTNVSEIDVVQFDKSTVRLNMYSEQSGRFCGLPDDCLCMYQSVIELVEVNYVNSTMRKWQVNPGEIVKNFHDPVEMFGLNVITNSVSSSKECTSTGTRQEYTTISLMKSENLKMNHEDVFNKIEGYLKDAEIFKHEDDVYVMLAIYYDKVHATHRTNSLLYRVHTGNATLVQEILTDGAWSIKIFQINHYEVFLLIGCFGESSESLLYRFDPIARKFEHLRTFASRSRYVKSLSQGKDHFILLDNPDTNAVNIYKYDYTSQNFHSYQSIFHTYQINGIECFYTDDFGNSDVFVIVTTDSGQFYIYEYMFAGKFQMKLQHTVDGLRTMMPFYYMDRHYILAGTDNNNMIFRIVKQGPH